MKISEVLKEKKWLSFEVFPPKEDQPMQPLLETLEQLYRFEPSCISCTYGAGGTSQGRSIETCAAIKKSGKSEIIAHLTCIGNRKEDVNRQVAALIQSGVENMLLLRGDLPAGWTDPKSDFAHANELISYVKSIAPALCIAGGCYPEKHVEADTFDQEIDSLRKKCDAGAEFFITQLCHDENAIYKYLNRLRNAGISQPVIIGIMPVLNKDSIIRMTLSNGCSIPAPLARIMALYEGKPDDFRAAGKEYTANMVQRLLDAGVDGVHIFTLNRYKASFDILAKCGIYPKT